MFNFITKNHNNPLEQEDLVTIKKQLQTIEVVSRQLVVQTRLDDTLETIISVLTKDLGYVNSLIFLVDDSNKYLKVRKLNVPEYIINLTEKLIRQSIYEVELKLTDDNLLSRTIEDKKIYTSNNFIEVFRPILNDSQSSLIQRTFRIHSVVVAPIERENVAVGCLVIGKREKEFSESELKVISTFANQISTAIYNAKLFNEIQTQVEVLTAKNHDLQSLYTLTANVTKTLDPKQVSQSAVDSLPQDQSMVGAVLGSYDEESKEIRVIATSQNQLAYQVQKVIGNFGQYVVKVDAPEFANNTSVKVLKSNKPIFTNNLEDYMSPPIPKKFVPIITSILNIKSLAVYPVISRGKVIGVIAFLMREKLAEELEDNEKQLLTTYSNQIGIALDNANLFKMSQEVQQNLEIALKKLEEVRKHERDMIDIMGHELRTPISIVRNALLMIDKQAKTNPQQPTENIVKLLEMAVDSTRREVALIETLLSATKTDGKGFQLLLEKIDLLNVVQNSLNAFQKDAEKKGLTINYTQPSEPLYIYGDKTRVQEVSDNFFSNAVKYTLKGSIDISLSKDDNLGYISIKDSGIGITEGDLKRLGEKFFRARQYIDDQIAAHPELKEKIEVVRPGGTGLGLFVTFNLIKIMDGRVDVQSKVGEGSTFTFGLPLYTNQPTQQVEKRIEKD